MKRHLIVVPPGVIRMRLEDLLLETFPQLSRMYIRDLVKGGHCEVNGRNENRGFRVSSNDVIEIDVDDTRGTAMRPESIGLAILFEDEHLLAVDKPAGMLMHPSHREHSGTLLNALAFHCNLHSETLIRPGLPHRLDKETSGIVIVAKTPKVHARVSAQFMRKSLEKRYLAVVGGIVEAEAGEISAPIGRFAEQKVWGVKDDGKPSVSRFRVIERSAGRTFVELEPVTGRTNQLRIHCAHLGHPIVGDAVRGGGKADRLYLHASSIALDHPISNVRMHLAAEPPPGFREAIRP